MLPTSKSAHLQGRAREEGGGKAGRLGMEGAAEGFGTLIRVEGGWGGEGGGRGRAKGDRTQAC